MKELALKIENVSKTYKDTKALRSLSFEVEKAVCYGLLGPNGAGKTTMMKILYGKTRRDDPQEGQVNVFGYDPRNNDLEIKYLSGIVPQEDNLDQELTVLQNLLIYSRFYGLSKKESLPRIEYLLEFMELLEKKDSRIRELSGGMKRRLTIARSLINSPKLLILDEPTTGLDPQVRHIIWDKLRQLKKDGVTMLLTTHYMEEAFQLCDTLAILDKGEKVLEGNPRILVEENIEQFVLEIYNTEDHECMGQPMDECLELPADVRMEQANGRTLLYSNKFKSLEVIRERLLGKDLYLRQANLEDLFLKATGRNLNE
ncbi:MAG: ABC transporter ATP-binding protein [bacterium]|nr:ABC transporter ATP-binding protein [bacterium]